jgi:hypothetical protein
MKRRSPATAALSVGGSLLLLVAAIHLAVTPLLRDMFVAVLPEAAARFWAGPFLLDHVAVGILLVPVGLTTLFAARAPSRAVALANAAAVLALPFALVALVGREHLAALPFLVAAALVTVAGLVLVAAALALPPPGPP